jgi:phage terminase small subunit
MPEPAADSAGSTWLESMTAAYDFDPHERALLVSAAQTLDEIAAMEAALAESGPVVNGSTGQPRVNPLVAALSTHRLTLLKLVKALGIEPEPAAQTPEQHRRSAQAQHAAKSRWAVRHGAA